MDRKRISHLSRMAKKIHDKQEQCKENMHSRIELGFYCIKRVCSQERKRIHRRIARDKDEILRYLEDISKEYRGIMRLKNNPPEFREILTNLLNADREGFNFAFNRHDISFCFPVYDVTVSDSEMGDICLGDYEVVVHYPCGEVSVTGGYYEKNDCNHPHVSGGVLCTGDSTAVLNTCLENGDILSIVDIIDSTLRAYNPDSPYISLDELVSEEEECECCSAYADKMYECYRCGHMVCDYCINCCTTCREDVCRDCLISCELCGNRFCGDDDNCGGMCSVCEDFICNSCRVECDVCSRYICSSCSNEHEGNAICNECYEEIENTTESDGENDNKTESDVHTPSMG